MAAVVAVEVADASVFLAASPRLFTASPAELAAPFASATVRVAAAGFFALSVFAFFTGSAMGGGLP
ncbi:hypothetical protein DQ392_07065 [Streptomyces reniochalinae]|uniref:Uncharacterized protein n=1 Tax=Streptomyces reniochalinae TaxID=2250578 RepID=A0A367EVZ6_9ACTN|nr:hypothetical protein DQ392_07065 [Streptomyces reniochalinae]